MLDERKERVEHRREVDAQLDALGAGATGRTPDRATWGLRPEHQRAMRAARDAGGAQANVTGTARRGG